MSRNKKNKHSESPDAQPSLLEHVSRALQPVRNTLRWLDPFTYVDVWVMPRLNPEQNPGKEWIIYAVFSLLFAFALYTGLGFVLGTPTPLVIVISGSMEPLYHRGDVVILHGESIETMNLPSAELPRPSLRNTLLRDIAFVEPDVRQTPGATAKFVNLLDTNQQIPVEKTGPVVVYTSTCNQPIVHRAIVKLKAADGWYVLTKGDSERNRTLDTDCGPYPAELLYPTCNLRQQACITFYPVPQDQISGSALFHVPLVGCLKLWVLDDLGSLLATGQLPAHFSGIC